VVSFGFAGQGAAIMRGAMVSGLIQQMLTTTEWGEAAVCMALLVSLEGLVNSPIRGFVNRNYTARGCSAYPLTVDVPLCHCMLLSHCPR
jgi:hypothetical protein